MTTVRHLEKLWNSNCHSRISRELLFGRPEQSLRVEAACTGPASAAALILIRLDELNLSHTRLAATALRTIIKRQDSDGGWVDLATTALCLRALRTSGGNGLSIDRGMQYLASLQKPEGIWPNAPIRRMPADPFVSAFVLFELGADERFRAVARIADAHAWFELNESTLDPEARRLWDHVAVMLNARNSRPVSGAHATLWS